MTILALVDHPTSVLTTGLLMVFTASGLLGLLSLGLALRKRVDDLERKWRDRR